ncbi:hypothetical protein [Mycobacterium kubicae]|uniref:hypothetical protein n=1 Tax=Mycobacterium kubicae TaxID=120959 RepID=UPI003BF79D9F
MTAMTEINDDSVRSNADALALAEEAEAEAAEAEALAAAARAKARATRLRRAALGASEEPGEYDEDEDYYDDGDEQYEDYYEEYSEDYPEDADEEYYEDEEEAEAAPEASGGRIRRAVRGVPWSIVAQLAAVFLILGFAGLSAYFVWKHDEANERQQRAAAFAAGAKQGVVNMTSLDFNKAKEDVQRVIDSSTGEFRDDFQARAADFTKVVEQSKVVTEGTVNATAVESMDGRTALVLVSATSRVTNSPNTKDEPRVWRLRVTVTEESGQYKMSKVEFVP